MSDKSNDRKPYVVVNRYRNGKRWREEGDELQLLPCEAQGPLSLGNIAEPEKAKQLIEEKGKQAAVAKKAAAKQAKTGDK